MALKFYEAYITTISKDPVESWRDLMQATINDTWENTSTIEKVLGQKTLGLKDYIDESVQLNSVIDPKTGKPLGDEYRKIIYKVLNDNLITKDFNNTTRYLGKYYKFGEFNWLVINTNTIIGASASAILQKCNNILKWYDNLGNYHEWDCVIERSLSSTNFKSGSEGVSEINADTLIKVQLNKETKLIEINQRFLFNGHAFQVKQINNHISESYMEIYLFETQIQSNDDIINNIANIIGENKSLNNGTIITPKINQLLENFSQKFSIYKYDKGLESVDEFEITTQGPTQGVNYKLEILDGNNFIIENLIKSDIPLVINCKNKKTSENFTKNILLIGEW